MTRMIGTASPDRYVVVALFEPLAVGDAFSRRHWPPHVTVASNFVTEGDAGELLAAVAHADIAAEPVEVTFAGEAMFGPNRTVRVQLVLPGPMEKLHAKLADQIETLPGFHPDSPDYWRGGYHPHVTHTPAGPPHEGETWSIRSIAVAQLSGSEATILAASDLPQPGSAARS